MRMPCLLCGNKRLKKIHDHGDGHALWRCANCGLLQTAPMPNDAELAAYYQRYDVLGEREPYYREMWGPDAASKPEGRAVSERFFWASKHCGKFGKILDVGSGPGLFLRLAKDSGGEPMGVELNGEAARRSQIELGIPVVAGTIKDILEKEFDTITLWDVLEHVADPVALVNDCRIRLKVGGWLFIETPDEGSLLDSAVCLLARFGLKTLAASFYGLHHLVLFRQKTMCRLLEKNGFAIIEIRGAVTDPGRIFRNNGFKDKMTRLALGALFILAKAVNKQNKMLIAARKNKD